MLSFWARYVLIKEKYGQEREVTLQQIENRFGKEKRKEIEEELVIN